MLFTDSFISNLKTSIPISKVIGSRVKLQKKGNYYSGLCPFHQEKTPSFTVSDHKESYYCFGCHAHGDLIQFVKAIDNLSFADSVISLANTAGIALPKLSPVEQKSVENQNKLVEVLSSATNWFCNQLKLSNNYHALEYLKNRGLNDQDINNFLLGYAPDKGLINFLKTQGYSMALLIEAGLVIKTEKNEFIERFRNRVIFPIKNHPKKQIVGFGGRALNNETLPKYLNSPETNIFKKSNLFYGLDLAYKNILQNKRAIVVEGYLDAIFMNKSGFGETIAGLGTAFNETHLQNLWKLADEPILCFDGDTAGKKAMLKAAYIALPLLSPGLTLNFCLLPKDKDPDELINTKGSNYLATLIENSIPLSEFIWQSELEQNKFDNPDSKAFFEHKLYTLIDQIQNQVIKNHYRQFIKNKLWQEFNQVKNNYTKKAKFINVRNLISPLTNTHTLKERLEYSLFAQLVSYPYLVADKDIYSILEDFEIDNQELKPLHSVLIEYHEDSKICLNDLLISNNLCTLVKFLCGNESSFIDVISTLDNDTSKKVWFLTYKKFLLELLKIEYNQFMMKANNESSSFEKAAELKKSIDNLIKEISEQENNLSQE